MVTCSKLMHHSKPALRHTHTQTHSYTHTQLHTGTHTYPIPHQHSQPHSHSHSIHTFYSHILFTHTGTHTYPLPHQHSQPHSIHTHAHTHLASKLLELLLVRDEDLLGLVDVDHTRSHGTCHLQFTHGNDFVAHIPTVRCLQIIHKKGV